MADDLVPKSFWSFPSFRLPAFSDLDRDEDWLTLPGFSNGLSVSEDSKNVYISAALPGVNPEEIEVTFDKGYLWIKGEVKSEANEEKKYYRKASSTFSYRIAVPGELDQNREPVATCKNGVMTVEFAKIPKTPPKKIQVKTT